MSRLPGTVTKIEGSASIVSTDAGVYRCDLRARLSRRLGQRLAVGDRVKLQEVETSGDAAADLPAGVIEELEPRRTVLRRARDFKRDQVLCANVDRVFVVVAVLDPPYKRAFIDRLVVGTLRDGLEPCLVFNKMDLTDAGYAEVVREDAAVYEDLGYPTFLVSASTGLGLDRLTQAFTGRISAVVGPSGVGKSTLLNLLCPGLRLRTGEVSAQDGRGRHTTTAAQLVALPGAGGFVVDTPGLRGFGLWDLTPAEVVAGFEEVSARAGECRFRDCAHRAEPDCAIRTAVEAGEVDEERYESYRHLVEELEAQGAARQASRRR